VDRDRNALQIRCFAAAAGENATEYAAKDKCGPRR
jgi:hypothetical protein